MTSIFKENFPNDDTTMENIKYANADSKKLNVKYFNMNDSEWADEYMQPCNEKIGDSGCALTGFAMIVNFLTGEGNPSTVNSKLGTNACDLDYTEAAKIYGFTILEGAVWPKDKKELDYKETAEYAVECITKGYPLLIGMADPTRGKHFVVAIGYTKNEDGSYTIDINDPGYRTRKVLSGYFNGTWGNYYTDRMFAFKK